MSPLKIIIRDLMRSIFEADPNHWPGHDSLQELLYDQYEIKASHAQIIRNLRELQDEGWVFTKSLKDKEGKFQGIGWFFNHKMDK